MIELCISTIPNNYNKRIIRDILEKFNLGDISSIEIVHNYKNDNKMVFIFMNDMNDDFLNILKEGEQLNLIYDVNGSYFKLGLKRDRSGMTLRNRLN